jgi:hypothetical protein
VKGLVGEVAQEHHVRGGLPTMLRDDREQMTRIRTSGWWSVRCPQPPAGHVPMSIAPETVQNAATASVPFLDRECSSHDVPARTGGCAVMGTMA